MYFGEGGGGGSGIQPFPIKYNPFYTVTSTIAQAADTTTHV